MHCSKHVISTNAISHCILGFSNFFFFYVKLVSVLLFVYKLMVYYDYYKVFKEFIFFLFFLSMPIDNVTRHARVGNFCALKPLIQYKSKTANVSFWFLAQTCFFCRRVCNFIKKETLAQVFSCEFCEISKNTFLYRAPLVAASLNNVH